MPENAITGRLSPAVEDYLKAIYKLQQAGATASTSDVAEALGISAASVTGMARRLTEMELARHEPYKGIRLTDAGTRIALEVIRHHRLLELYLKEVMDYSWADLHEEAERLEHHISEEFESKLDELLGHPTRDPHGHPIPTPEGEMDEIGTEHLAEVESGQQVIVCHLVDDDPALLTHLETRGLMPGAVLDVTEKVDFNGPLTVRIAGEEQIVGQTVARSVFVRPIVS